MRSSLTLSHLVYTSDKGCWEDITWWALAETKLPCMVQPTDVQLWVFEVHSPSSTKQHNYAKVTVPLSLYYQNFYPQRRDRNSNAIGASEKLNQRVKN